MSTKERSQVSLKKFDIIQTDDGAILLPSTSSKCENVFVLNSPAFFIAKLADDNCSTSHICDALADIYDISPNDVTDDVERCLSILSEGTVV